MMSDSARSTDTEPLEVLTFAGPVTTPTRTFPLLVETSAVPSTAPIRMSPEPLCTSAEPLTPSTVTSPTPLRTFSGPVSASRTAPRSVLSATVPSTPSAWKSPSSASPRTSESVGSWMTTSIDSGRLLLKLTNRLRGFLRDDAQRPGGLVVLDAGVLGRLDVGGLVRVAGADLDDRVGAVGDGEADVGDVEVEGDGDRGRGVEVRDGHLRFLCSDGFGWWRCVLCGVLGVSGPSRCSSGRRSGRAAARGQAARRAGPRWPARRRRPGRSRR